MTRDESKKWIDHHGGLVSSTEWMIPCSICAKMTKESEVTLKDDRVYCQKCLPKT